ncbi:MAG: HIT family protein [Actinobacteria bacterium]|nr:HIT family protein [Actinomycetota bacterium]
MPASPKPCPFCAIANGEQEAAHVVHETDDVVAFLDIRPVFVGHTLVVPRDHIDTLLDLPVQQLGPYFAEVQRVTAAVTKAMDAHGSFVAVNNVVSQSVPHLHTHVVPRRRKDGLRGFFWPRTKYEGETAMAEVASRIREAF